MRILHAVDILRPVGGAQTYVRRLAELQAAAGHEVVVVHGDEGAAPPAGVEVRRAGNEAAIVAECDPDVVHVHDWGLSEEVERGLAGERTLVRSLHNFSFACAAGTRWFRDGSHCTRAHGPGCLVAAATRGCAHRLDLRPFVASYRRIESQLPRVRATPFTVLGSAYMESIALANGVPRERCAAVPYFVEPPDSAAPAGADRIVCFSGRVVRNKGLDLLLDALACVPDAWDRLVVVGDGWDLERCRGLAGRLGLAERVEFRGWLEPDAAREAITGASVLAFPSRWPEPFGIVGLEAMALGRPVVAAGGGGVGDWLDDGETGLLFTAGDARELAAGLQRVLADGALAQRLGDEGRRRVTRFSASAHLDALERIYASPPGSRTPAPAGVAT